jgi:hypothetical protein
MFRDLLAFTGIYSDTPPHPQRPGHFLSTITFLSVLTPGGRQIRPTSSRPSAERQARPAGALNEPATNTS